MSDISAIEQKHNSYHDDHALLAAGYKPQLQRSLGFFSSFAVAFSFMSILMGIFANYGFVLSKAGPFGIWTWLLVGGGQFMVALVFAEMAGRLPLTGAIYNWNARLANPTIGWFTGWLMVFTYAIGTVGVIAAMFAPLQTFLGIEFDTNTMRLIGTALILLQALINIYGVRVAAFTNKLAVIAEMIALVVFGAVILAVIVIHGEANTSLILSPPETPLPYWGNFLTACLLAAWTIFGFETSSDLSEETVDVRRVTPKSILSAVLITVPLGFSFLLILTLAIPDLSTVTAATDPVSTIVAYHLGSGLTKVFLAFVLIAMFAASLLGITTASRLLFAVARDNRIIGSSVLNKISKHRVPAAAVYVITCVEIITFVFCQNMTDLYASPVILLAVSYLITVICFITGNNKLPSTGSFSLGLWHWPVVILAIVWLISEICILTIPDDFHTAAIIAGGVILSGLVLYGLIGRNQNPSRAISRAK